MTEPTANSTHDPLGERGPEGDWRVVPLAWATDLDHGGRWWSLTTDQREWLWTNPDGAIALDRVGVVPGDEFVDAGGGEECFPHVRGVPDHGDAWSRVWEGARAAAHVDTDHGRLARTVSEHPERLRLDYALTPEGPPTEGPTGPVTHAVHLLLDVSTDARLVVPSAVRTTVLDHPEVGQDAEAVWPTIDGVDLTRLGPDDGTATCAVLRGLGDGGRAAEAYVVDGDAMLGLRWGSDGTAEPGMMMWRNLAGWPDPQPYRSIGVEPMIEFSGPATWWLEVTAYERG
ncbi:hypothetical protein [Mariniluteicoccus flavus]